MSDNGKGSNTAKRTNFKKFNDGWDKLDWGNNKKPEPEKSIEELISIAQKKAEELVRQNKLDELTQLSQEMGLYDNQGERNAETTSE